MPLPGKAVARALAVALAVLGQPSVATAVKPRARGHFLTNSELGDIDTIACLEAKKKNPAVECASMVAADNGTVEEFSGKLSAGNYPSYKDGICGSGGEYFCDPSGALTAQERSNVTAALQRLRRANPVMCPSAQSDPVDPSHFQPFYLGVVVAKDWPRTQTDPESLHQLGQIIESQWNMDELYVGQPIPPRKPCGNTAMLIVMADMRLAYLSSGSCQFICQGDGARPVISRTLQAMDSKGAAAGVLAGIDEVYRTVSGVKEAAQPGLRAAAAPSTEGAEKHDPWLNPLLQVLFAVAIVFVVVAVLGAAMVMLLAPGFITARKRMPVN